MREVIIAFSSILYLLPLVHCSASSDVLKSSATDSENYNLKMCQAISQDIGGYDLSRHLNHRRKLTEVAIIVIYKAYIADIKLDKMRMKRLSLDGFCQWK